MRILLVSTFHYRRGGAEVHVLDLAEELTAQGHEVRHFAMHHPEELPSADSEYWVSEVDFRAMNANRSPINAVRVMWRAIYSTEARRALSRMIGDWRPDVVHVHNFHAHLTPSVIDAATSADVPVMLTLHDYKLLCPNTILVSHDEICERCKGNRFFECTRRRCKKDSRSASLVATLEAEAHRFLRLPKRVDRFVAPSEFLLGKFAEFGWPSDKIVYLPNFNSRPLASEVVMPEDRRVIYAGQLERYKGVMTLLEAIGRMPGIRLDIAGEGPMRPEIEAWLTARGAEGADVRLHGRVGPQELDEMLRAARVAVVPSQWYENSPYAVIEAFAAARPVVASRIGGLPELVIDGVNGITFTPGDASMLAEAVLRILDDPPLWNELAHGALRTAAERDVRTYALQLEEVYADVARGAKRA